MHFIIRKNEKDSSPRKDDFEELVNSFVFSLSDDFDRNITMNNPNPVFIPRISIFRLFSDYIFF